MTVSSFDKLVCPLDGSPLHSSEKSWRCDEGHSFDVARQGYVNLLPVQKKRSRDPGDSKEMVAARQRFLNGGYYRPIADAVSRLVMEALSGGSDASCLDAGCGEGYYLRQLADAVPESVTVRGIGLDISKWAVLAAAKQDRGFRWVVGSNANLPVLTGSVDSVLCLFGFPVFSEFARVLRAGGVLLLADAGPDHLRELREIIYPELKTSGQGKQVAPPGFALTDSEELRFDLFLPNSAAIADLLAMTPHLYRASSDGRDKAARLESLTVTVDVRFRVFRKT